MELCFATNKSYAAKEISRDFSPPIFVLPGLPVEF